MILENIKDFNWYNDPQNVRFVNNGMLIETRPRTDFWQNIDSHFQKDNGHLFAQNCGGNFVLTVKWSFPLVKNSAQCGLMFRSDTLNWIKAGLLAPRFVMPQLGVVSANQGSCDWSAVELPLECRKIWLRLSRRSKDFVIMYSLNGNNFHQIRMLHLPKVSDVAAVGAYACSPSEESFECVLEEIELAY